MTPDSGRRDNQSSSSSRSARLIFRVSLLVLTVSFLGLVWGRSSRSIHNALSPSKSDLLGSSRSSATETTASNPAPPAPQQQQDEKLTAEPPRGAPVTPTPKPTKDERILFYLHVHKSGGTSLCQAAAQNLRRTAINGGANCNVQQDQRCCGGADSLEAHQKFANSTRYRFVACERDMYETMDLEHYRYIVTLRRSAERYLSHYRHYYASDREYTDSFQQWWKGQPDNWTVRKMCGTRCTDVPKYQLTEELFQHTLLRLDKFEDLLFVENYEESFRRFAQRVGWKYTSVPKANVQGNVDLKKMLAEWDPFMSALDDALYEHAQAKFDGNDKPEISAKRIKVVEQYFADGPSRKCADVCCGSCSPYR